VTLDPTTLAFALAALVLAALLGAALASRLARWRDRSARRAIARVGARAERDAERLLQRAGYRILDRQVTGRWTLRVDGDPVDVTCRADLLVERRGRRLVAEVKSAGPAVAPTAPATRRQLLEYTMAFDVDGVVLVDMQARAVVRVEFPRR
jgi:hypothetical protein